MLFFPVEGVGESKVRVAFCIGEFFCRVNCSGEKEIACYCESGVAEKTKGGKHLREKR